jgi:hypothetical protein
MRSRLAGLIGVAIVVAAFWPSAVRATGLDFMFSATVDGKPLEGRPLAWTDDQMYLLGRDGRLHSFDPHDAKDARRTSPYFYGYTIPEMKRELYNEFGDSLDITTTQHYIVVHPRGQGKEWANRFEDLYRSFLAYFRVRGFQPEEPKFPLVAVVFRNKDDYYKAAEANGTKLPSGMLGHYDNQTNRVQLFDVTAGNTGGEWSENADTIIHEATHQTAFNTGIHNRFSDQPRWLVEGLATMFEARGVWNSQSFHSLKDRLNRGRFNDFRTFLKDRKPGTFGNLISSDQLFRTEMTRAYAEAWAMVLFLCETRPRQLAQYMELTASRPDFSSYFASQRVADFQACFGNDLKQLEANFLAWMAEIK